MMAASKFPLGIIPLSSWLILQWAGGPNATRLAPEHAAR